MHLLDFAEAHPKGDDVLEAILLKPFNRKCQLTSVVCSPLPPIIFNLLSSVRGVVSSPPDHHQGEPQPSTMSSLLPKKFQRRFSQRKSTAQPYVNSSFPMSEQELNLNPLFEVPEIVKPDGFDGVHLSSLHYHLPPGFKIHFAVKFSPLQILKTSRNPMKQSVTYLLVIKSIQSPKSQSLAALSN